jgi:hypothetical protein
MTLTLKRLLLLAIVLLGLGLRVHAALTLPVDDDEPNYLTAGLDYNNFLRAGQLKMLAWHQINPEHPALYKILYGLALFTQPPLEQLHEKHDIPNDAPIAQIDARPWLMAGRWLSVLFSGLTGLVLTAVSPLAGLAFALQTLAIRYGSLMYLEALPLWMSTLAAVAYLRAFPSGQTGKLRWLLVSALALGGAVASKYTYGVVGLAILLHAAVSLIHDRALRPQAWKLIAWGLVALAAFFALNPVLWPHPVERLAASLSFHGRYQANDFVRQSGYPWYQPVLWVLTSMPARFPALAPSFLVAIDRPIFLLALLGLPFAWRRQRLFVLWLITGLLVTFVWPTKWTQYPMIFIVPLCIVAAEGALAAARWLQKLLRPTKQPVHSP